MTRHKTGRLNAMPLLRRFLFAMPLVLTLVATGPHARAAMDLMPEQEAAVAAVNSYLNSLVHLEGDFTQLGPNGEVSEGRFYIRRPGRARFDYAEPNRLLVIADGFWIGVQDRKLGTTDRYPIASTPYWALLKEQVDLRVDARILNVEREPGTVVVSIDDPSGEAAGELTLIFEEYVDAASGATAPQLVLSQWLVTDAQGLTTSVTVQNLVSGQPTRNRMFVIRDIDRR